MTLTVSIQFAWRRNRLDIIKDNVEYEMSMILSADLRKQTSKQVATTAIENRGTSSIWLCLRLHSAYFGAGGWDSAGHVLVKF